MLFRQRPRSRPRGNQDSEGTSPPAPDSKGEARGRLLRLLRRPRLAFLASTLLLFSLFQPTSHPGETVGPPRLVSLGAAHSSLRFYSTRPVVTESAGPLEVRRTYRFVWPGAGNLTSYFNIEHPMGIDIGFDPDEDSPVFAAARGTVTFAGGVRCCSYGLYVIVEHEGGFSTLYGHLSRFAIKLGDMVEQGDLLGMGGMTGEADGKHLHFEVRKAQSVVDPLAYLPSEQDKAGRQPRPERLDCATKTVAMDQRSSVVLAWKGGDGEYKFEDVEVRPASGRPLIEAEAGSKGLVLSGLEPATAGARAVEHRLAFRVTGGNEDTSVECRVLVRPPLKSPPGKPKPKATPTASVTATPLSVLIATPTSTPVPPPPSTPTPIRIATPVLIPTSPPPVPATSTAPPPAATPTTAPVLTPTPRPAPTATPHGVLPPSFSPTPAR